MPNNGKLFISHTHADNERCQPLLAALDAWQIDYWYDGQQLDAGQQLSPRLQEAILGRDVLLRVCTTNTPSSYWMNLELSAFRTAQYQQGKGSQRVSIDLILDAAYTPSTLERADVSVLAANKPERVWLAELASALGKKQSQQQRSVSRRAFVSLGGAAAVTAAGLAGSALVVKSRNDLAAKPYPKPRTIPFSNPQTMDPRIRWYFAAGDETGAAMALAGERLLLNTNDGVFALNTRDGSVLWSRIAIQGSADFGLVVNGDTVYASGSGVTGSLYALRVADGSILWTTTVSSTFGDLGFTFANDSIYMINDAPQMACYSARDGSLRWNTTKLHFSGLSTHQIPIADAVAAYVGTDDGQMAAFSVADGSRLWSFQTGGALSYSPALANGVLYFGSKDSRLYAVNARDGSLKWRFDASQIDGASDVSYTPTVVGNIVYIGLYANVVALNATTGELLWKAPLGGQNDNADVTGSMTVAGDTLYAPAEQYLYAFSLKTRQPLWRVATRSFDINSQTPMLVGATAYWSGGNGFIYALNTTA